MIDVGGVVSFMKHVGASSVPGWNLARTFEVKPLAQGEYNLNYLVCQGRKRWVFRVNLGTQIGRQDQIEYEFKALRLLSNTGVTPQPYLVDDSREKFPYGVLLMEYLPGGPLDYSTDLNCAAQLFARIHSDTAGITENHLITETNPLSMTWDECNRLLQVYFESDLAVPGLCEYLRDVLDWAEEARHKERYFKSDPWFCIINTEVNSGNFIVNRQKGTIHLVDWEKPLWGDPSQDLSHFCAPTTTLWKTNFRMSPSARQDFLDSYRAALHDRHLRETILDRVMLRDPFNCLRGISWSAMAWIAYQTGAQALRNADTFRKIEEYLEIRFLRSLFDRYLV